MRGLIISALVPLVVLAHATRVWAEDDWIPVQGGPDNTQGSGTRYRNQSFPFEWSFKSLISTFNK